MMSAIIGKANLEKDDVFEALAYAAEAVNERQLPLVEIF